MGESEFMMSLYHHLELEPAVLVLMEGLGVCEGRMTLTWEPEKRLAAGQCKCFDKLPLGRWGVFPLPLTLGLTNMGR